MRERAKRKPYVTIADGTRWHYPDCRLAHRLRCPGTVLHSDAIAAATIIDVFRTLLSTTDTRRREVVREMRKMLEAADGDES